MSGSPIKFIDPKQLPLDCAIHKIMNIIPSSFLSHNYLEQKDIKLNHQTFSWPDRIMPMIKNMEQKLTKEHDIAVNRLNNWKKEFTTTLNNTLKEVQDFKTRDRMSEAENYLLTLQEIAKKIEGFQQEVWIISSVS